MGVEFVMSYTPTGSAALWTVLETVVVSNDATIDIDLTGTHDEYVFHIQDLVPSTDVTELWMRFSVDAGSTFLAGAADYAWNMDGGQPTSSTDGDASISEINLTKDFSVFMGTGTIESLNSWVRVHNAKQTASPICVTGDMAQIGDTGAQVGMRWAGSLFANFDEVDAVRFLSSSGNLSTGTITLYGVS